MRRANQWVSFKLGNFQLLDFLEFPDGATNLNFVLKAYKTTETKIFFPFEWFDHSDKLSHAELAQYQTFYNEFRICNPPETECQDYENLIVSGTSREPAWTK